MVQPKRRVSVRVLVGSLAGVLVALLVNLTSSDIDGALVDRFGRGYTMQFVLSGVGWEYLPHAAAVVGVLGVWWWSQGAPPPGATIVSYGLAEAPARSEPERSVCSDGIRWVFVQRNYVSGLRMRPECCTHGVELRLRRRDGSTVPLATRDHAGVLSEIPYCAEGHEVAYTRSANYAQASSTARALLEARLRGH